MFRHPTCFAIAFIATGTTVELVRASQPAMLAEAQVVPAAFTLVAHGAGGHAWPCCTVLPWSLLVGCGALPAATVAAMALVSPVGRCLRLDLYAADASPSGDGRSRPHHGRPDCPGYMAGLPLILGVVVFIIGVVILREPRPAPPLPPGMPPGGFTG